MNTPSRVLCTPLLAARRGSRYSKLWVVPTLDSLAEKVPDADQITSLSRSVPRSPHFHVAQIARDWNTKDETSGWVGYVLRFSIQSEFLQAFPVRTVGSAVHQEYWIPADELDACNDHIDGLIEPIACFRA
jgi:hypothetical protein